ncbi:hypothetical protein [Fervidibacter sacchari]
MPFIVRHSLLTVRHSLLATRYLPLAAVLARQEPRPPNFPRPSSRSKSALNFCVINYGLKQHFECHATLWREIGKFSRRELLLPASNTHNC